METIEQIKEDEGGYQAEVYLCTAKKLTWLYGRNIEDRPILPEEWAVLSMMIEKGATQKDWAEALFNEEINQCIGYLRRAGFPRTDYPNEVGDIMVNMIYNMGSSRFNPRKWPNFFTAIKARDWSKAALEGRDSKWWRVDVRTRAERLMHSMERVTEK